MFNIVSRTAYSVHVVASFATFHEAEAYAFEVLNAFQFEADADYPGCADFITVGGSLYVVEPA